MRRASKRTSNEDGFNPVTVRKTESTHCQSRKHTFDLAEAPTFYPTSDEFADPLKYIDKIRVEAEKYGIAKIVPPKEYKPEFCIKTKVK
jgi:histone demethylase JARID1